jgi:predicted phosphodiesterase
MRPIWFLGDNHAGFDYIVDSIDEAKIKPVAVIFLGDIEAPIPFEDCIEDILRRDVDVRWIIGNHDTDTEENYRNLLAPESMARNIDGKIIDIDGIRIAGLGGVFRGEIWLERETANAGKHGIGFRNYDDYKRGLNQKQGVKRRLSKMDIVQGQAVPDRLALLVDETKNGKLRKHRSSIFPDVYDALAKQRADILVTHEAPHCHPLGFEELSLLADSMRVKTHFHGHQHDNLTYPLLYGRIRVHGVGLRGISDQDGDVIKPGELDDHRAALRQSQVTR